MNFTLKKTKFYKVCEEFRMSDYLSWDRGRKIISNTKGFICVDLWKDVDGIEHDNVCFDNQYVLSSITDGQLSIVPRPTLDLLSSFDSNIEIIPTNDSLSQWTSDEHLATEIQDVVTEYTTICNCSDTGVVRDYYVTISNNSNSSVTISCLKIIKTVYCFSDIIARIKLDTVRDWHTMYLISNSYPRDFPDDINSYSKKKALYACLYLDTAIAIASGASKTIKISVGVDDITESNIYLKKMNGWYAFESARLMNSQLTLHNPAENQDFFGYLDVENYIDLPADNIANRNFGDQYYPYSGSEMYSHYTKPYEVYTATDELTLQKTYLCENDENTQSGLDNIIIRGIQDYRWIYPENRISNIGIVEKHKMQEVIFSPTPYSYTSFLHNKIAVFVSDEPLANHQKNQPTTITNFFKNSVDTKDNLGFAHHYTQYLTEDYIKYIDDINENRTFYRMKGLQFIITLYNDLYENGYTARCVKFMKPDISSRAFNSLDSNTLWKTLYFVPYIYYYLPSQIFIPYKEQRQIIINITPESIEVTNNA